MTPPGLHLENSGLSYAGHTIFQDLSADLAGGSWTALLGPSGVGKTSLLRLIAGLPARSGVVSGSVTAADGNPLPGRVAYMAQRDLLLPWLSVLENVMLGSRLRGNGPNSGDQAKAMSLLDQVGLADQAQDLPAQLSGGMRQRAALARTLYEDRPIVLMDEPFSALDAVTRFRLQNLAARLLEGRTVFLVTHDPMEALRLADTILVLTGSPARLSRVAPPPSLPRPRDTAVPDMAESAARLMRELADDGRAAS